MGSGVGRRRACQARAGTVQGADDDDEVCQPLCSSVGSSEGMSSFALMIRSRGLDGHCCIR